MAASSGLMGQLSNFVRSLSAPKRPEPSYPTLPEVDDLGHTNIPGIYLAGEAAGTPLIKLGLNQGHRVLEQIHSELGDEKNSDPELLDVLIVGSGSAGLAATVHAKDRGLRSVTLEAAAFANTVHTMMKGKLLLAEPEGIPLEGRVWFEECRKEELLKHWNALVKDEELDIRCGIKVQNISGQSGDFQIETNADPFRAKRVLLAIGKAGNPRRLGIPGETEQNGKIAHRLLDPDDFKDQKILIVGAGDVAAEAAIALSESNTVTLSAIDKEFIYPKKRNIDAMRALESEGKLEIALDTSVTEIGASNVTMRLGDGSTRSLENDFVFEMIGAELPLPFFKRVGIKIRNRWDWQRWATLFVCFLAVYTLYALKKYVPLEEGGRKLAAWPFQDLIAGESYDKVLNGLFRAGFAPFRWAFGAAALAAIDASRDFKQGYLYSLLYSLLMMGFGYEALIRWRGIASNSRYQTWRYASLVGFQLSFFLGVNIIGLRALGIQHAWRAWGLYQPFPLFFNTFFWWDSSSPPNIVMFFVGAGLIGTFVIIPVMARFHGKRFCTWICGCGGLAETLGDRWRHLAAKGQRSRRWEFQASLVMAASFLVATIVVGAYQTNGSNLWWKAYDYIVDFWLVAVIPVALYPFFGGKVWCRYWCPLAAYNGLLSKLYGKLKIVSDEKCISCTQCSTYCQVGVDVMSFAKNQQPFDNSNSACIHCGICIDVCPMNVLSFESSNSRATELIAQGRSTGRALPMARTTIEV